MGLGASREVRAKVAGASTGSPWEQCMQGKEWWQRSDRGHCRSKYSSTGDRGARTGEQPLDLALRTQATLGGAVSMTVAWRQHLS